jgi:hypothetical protein
MKPSYWQYLGHQPFSVWVLERCYHGDLDIPAPSCNTESEFTNKKTEVVDASLDFPGTHPFVHHSERTEVSEHAQTNCRHGRDPYRAAARDAAGLEKIKILFVPLATMEERITAVEDGDIDIECGATTVTLSRRERVDFTLMTFITGSAVLSLKSKPINSVDDFQGAEIAVLEGTTTEDVMRKVIDINEFDIDLELISSHDEGVKLLNEGKVDG